MARPSDYDRIEKERGLPMADILFEYLEVQKLSLEDAGEQLGVSSWTAWNWAKRTLAHECHWVRRIDITATAAPTPTTITYNEKPADEAAG